MRVSKDDLIIWFLWLVPMLTDWDDPVLVELAECVSVAHGIEHVWLAALLGGLNGDEAAAIEWARDELRGWEE